METRTIPRPLPPEPAVSNGSDDLVATQADPLVAERRLYQTSIDALDDVFLVVDADGRVVRWNDRLRAVTGRADDDLAGAYWSQVVGVARGQACVRVLADAMSAGELAMDGWLLSPDARRIPYRWTGAIHTPADGAGRLLCLSGRDVTERTNIERYLCRAIEATLRDPAWIARGILDRFVAEADGEPGKTFLHELTKREADVLERLAQGWNNSRIAADLGLAHQTVKNYVKTIYEKLQVRTRAEAVVWARRRGLGLA